MENQSYSDPGKATTTMAASFHESELRNKILKTHDHNELDFDAKAVLIIVEIMLRRSVQELPGLVDQEPLRKDVEDMITLDSHPKDIIEVQRVITSILGQICSHWLEQRDSHATTLDILHMMKPYKWDAKAVLTLATLATSLGEFRLVEQLRFTNPLARAVSQLKLLPEKLVSDENSRAKLKALLLLITAILDLTKSTVELYELLGSEYLTAGAPPLDLGDVTTAVYWTIRSSVDCAMQIYVLTSAGPEYLLDPWELSSTAHKLKTIENQISEKIDFFRKYIEKKKDYEVLEAITRFLETSHVDNSKSLDIFFRDIHGHQRPLFDCLQQNLVSVEVLRNKVVGLYITDLNIVTEDYLILQQVYPEKLDDETRIECPYEIVWYPVVDNWTNEKNWRFESLRDQMEWLSVTRPSDTAPQAIRYIKEKCSYIKKPCLLVMDTDGKIVHKDALKMLCIWGNLAYPFSSDRERFLWQEVTWSISLLAGGIDQILPDWINTGKSICLYGGEDLDWIKKFTKAMKNVAKQSGIDMEFLYLGKNRARERVVKKIINVVRREKLSAALEWKLVAYFWLRLEKMCVSEPQETRSPEFFTPDELGAVFSPQTYNPILSGVIKMLSFGSSSKGWVAISVGPYHSHLFEADGEVLLRVLADHEEWKRSEESYGFATALSRYYHNLCNDYVHCMKMLLSETELKGISCAVCSSPMDKMVMYSCCSDRSSFGYNDHE